MQQKEINLIKKRAMKASEDVSMQDVLTLIGYSGRQRKRGSQLFYQCINGCDPKGHLDKCSINLSRNLSHCFSCGKGWGPAKLFSDGLGIPYMDACLILAKQVGEISEEEYRSCMDSAANYNKLVSDAKILTKIDTKRAEETAEFRAPVAVIDLVYRHLLALPEFKLSDASLRYLINKRGLSEREIKESRFFTYQRTFSIDQLVRNIQQEEPAFSYSDLWGVPGFYFVFADSTKTKGNWCFRRPIPNGTGIPLYNAEGKIVALQIRNMTEDKGKNVTRYFFITSKGYTEKGKDCAYGSSPGSPAHVEYPDVVTNSTFIIGEGKFKMMEAAKEGSVSISCQGVTNYHFAVHETEAILRSDKLKSLLSDTLKGRKSPLSFVIAFDADMFGNYAVLQAALGLFKALSKRYPGSNIFFLVWDISLGKGYDDLKEYCSRHKLEFKKNCFSVVGKTMELLSTEAINETDQYFGLTDENAARIRKEEKYRDALFSNLWGKRLSLLNPFLK